jgi:uncharacterized protein (TIGR02246 family)
MSDQTAVRALMGRLADAWNDGDAHAFAQVFTEDADYITFFGLHTQGRTAIEEVHRPLFAGPLKGSRLTGGSTGDDGVQIRFLRPDVALVVATGGSTLQGAAAPDPSRDSILTFVAVRDHGEWSFASFQNTRRSTPPGLGGAGGVGMRSGERP